MIATYIRDTFQGHPLHLYLPSSYGDSEKHYPVVYVQDGGDLIDPAHSDILQQIGVRSAAGSLPEFLFVGIEPLDRDDEYTPFVAPNVFWQTIRRQCVPICRVADD